MNGERPRLAVSQQEAGWLCTVGRGCVCGEGCQEAPRTPKRIQRQRTKGWRMPEGAVYVGRPSKWGNPFMTGSNQPDVFVHDGVRVLWSAPRSPSALKDAHQVAVNLFRARWQFSWAGVRQLRGKDLACWCAPDLPCHADVLLEWANEVERP